MAQEEVIIEIKVESADAVKGLDQLQKNIIDLKKEQEKLNNQLKEGEIGLEEYTKATSKNNKELKSNESAVKNLTNAIESEKGSINELNKENRELIKIRNRITLDTDEGRKKYDEINKKINENTEKIKANVSSLEKQRLNIGNYKSALDGVGGSLRGIIPGLGGMTTGLSGITAGAKAFTATPFGATLQIIAGLLAVLIDAFKGSEEGQRNLNKITQVTTALFGALGDGIRLIGDYLIAAFENPKKTMLELVDFLKNNIINRFTAFGVILEGVKNLDFKQVSNGVLQFGSGIEDVIGKVQNLGERIGDVANKALENGRKVAQLQAEIEDMEDEAKARRAKNDLEVAKLREKAISQEGDAKKKTIEQAIAIEKQSAEESVRLAQKRVELAQFELSIATNKKEATDKLEDAEVALTEAQSERYQATLRFQKEIERLNDAETARQQKLAADEEKWRREAAEREIKIQQDKNKKIREDAEKNAEYMKRISEGLTAYAKKSSDKQLKFIEDQRNAEFALRNAKQQAALDTLNFVSSLFEEGSKAQKFFALAELATNFGISLSNGLRIAQQSSLAAGPGAAVAFPIFYATQLSAILATISKARAIINSGGESSGSVSIPSSGAATGFRSIEPNGVTISSAATNPINQSFSVANAMSNMPPVYASWKEATEVQNRIKFKESLTTV